MQLLENVFTQKICFQECFTRQQIYFSWSHFIRNIQNWVFCGFSLYPSPSPRKGKGFRQEGSKVHPDPESWILTVSPLPSPLCSCSLPPKEPSTEALSSCTADPEPSDHYSKLKPCLSVPKLRQFSLWCKNCCGMMGREWSDEYTYSIPRPYPYATLIP